MRKTFKNVLQVTILILIDGFLQYVNKFAKTLIRDVTILILIDGFLQYVLLIKELIIMHSHNPYFNRWFSAILTHGEYSEMVTCHNPYFNRWFSAI